MMRLKHSFNLSGSLRFCKISLLTAALLLLASGSMHAQYCTSIATYTGDEDIYNVTFGTLNNTSTCTTVAGPGSTLERYSDFTGLTPPSITAGSTVPLSVQVGTCGGNYSNAVAVWIDYNRDGTFDNTTERVYASTTTTNGPNTVTANIVIPTTVSYGTTRMRVLSNEGSVTSFTACSNPTWGETEDYTINLIPAGPPSCFTEPLTPTNGSTTACAGNTLLRWNTKIGAIGYDVYLDAGTGTPVTRIANNIPDTFIRVPTVVGPYVWKIIPKNITGPATGCSIFTFTTILGAVAGANVVPLPDTLICPEQPVTFTATPVDGGASPSYQWQKNGVNVGTNNRIYRDSMFMNGDLVRVVVTTSLTTGCITTPTGPSRDIRLIWKPIPSTTITTGTTAAFCSGGSVTLSVPATAVTYQWRRNGVNISTNANTTSYTAIYTGNYSVRLLGSNGCFINSPATTVTVYDPVVPLLVRNGNVVSTANYYATYQWYKNDVVIPGATSSSYTFSHDGQYSVAVKDTIGCTGTSSHLPVNELSIGNTPNASSISIYPNPASAIVKIIAPELMNIRITGLDGKTIISANHTDMVDVSKLSQGLYLIYLSDKNNQVLKIEKLTKL